MRSSLLLLSSILVIPSTALAEHPAGATIPDAATVDITPAGFEVVTEILPGLLPGALDVPAISDGEDADFPECLLGKYGYEFSGAYVEFQVASASIVPQAGRLSMEVTLLVSVNDPSDPFYLWGEVECLSTSCDGYVDPFYATVTTDIGLRVAPDSTGEPVLDATVGALALDYTLSGSNIHLDDCAIGTVEEVLNWFGLSLYDLILSFAEPYINDLVVDFGPEIETMLEDSFSALQLNEEIDVSGVAVAASLQPSDVEISPAGVRIYMDGSMTSTAVHPCVAEFDSGGSLETLTETPVLGSAPSGVPTDYHAALNLSDDLGNQALYSIWRGGLLCYTVDEELTGFALDTGLLNSMAGGTFEDLFPEPKPLVIQTRPAIPPTLVFDGDNDIGLSVNEMGLDFYAELDGRQTRVVGMDLDLIAGADLVFDGTTGEMDVLVDLGTDALAATVNANEFKPGTESEIEENFSGLFETLIGSVVGGLVEDIAVALPSMEGLGLTRLDLAGAGDERDWLGGYASIGVVSYGAGGGCDDESGGCSGGCATGRTGGGRLALVVLPLALVILRRRRG